MGLVHKLPLMAFLDLQRRQGVNYFHGFKAYRNDALEQLQRIRFALYRLCLNALG
jgi:hypothetical protein